MPASRDLLRFMTCGSVDDGKSTLIGRLLFETRSIPDDQLNALQAESRSAGARRGDFDFALLLDGLAAEHEQGVTIDVAHRYFSTQRRNFIIADAPGHEQYTRNMANAASTADLALLLVDVRKGLRTQTRRHSCIAALLGVPRVVLVVNKMDLVDFSQQRFDAIAAEFAELADRLKIEDVLAIPVCAALGDNLAAPSRNMSWYRGPSLLTHLEEIDVDAALGTKPFRMPVQWVSRPDSDFRGFAGLIVSGEVRPGDRVRVLPSGKETSVTRIVAADGDLAHASANASVTLTLEDEIDIGRGDVIAAAQSPPEVARDFEAALIWMSETPLSRGRRYLMKLGAKTTGAAVTHVLHRLDVATLEPTAARTLQLNEIGDVHMSLDARVTFEPYLENRALGGFILIDPVSNDTVAAGLIRAALRRSHVYWQAIDVDKAARAAMKGQRPAVVWFTGLPGAGKSTIANHVERRLHAHGRHSYVLDGDNLRHGLNRDLGFADADRAENIRRVAEVAKLMADAGLVVLVSLISPFRAERRIARDLMAPGEFIEVFVDTPLAVAEARDPKGLYHRARTGELKNFTGVDSPYERPEQPEIRIEGDRTSPEDAAERIILFLEEREPG